MEDTQSYQSLLLIILLAVAVPVLLKRVKRIEIPGVVGEIVAGIIIGTSGLNLVASSPQLEFLDTFGFAFLIFLCGLETDFSLLTSSGGNIGKKTFERSVPLGLAIYPMTLLLSILCAFGLYSAGLVNNVFFIALLLSPSAMGIAVPIMKEKKVLCHEYGQTLLVAVLLGDFMTMILVTLYVSFVTTGSHIGILTVLMLFVVFFAVYKIGSKFLEIKPIEELAGAISQIEVRGSFALIFVFIVLAEYLGTEMILGAFLAGVIVSLLNDRNTSGLFDKLDAIGYGFFIPIFFIKVGVDLHLKSAFSSSKALILVPIILLMVYFVKVVPALILKKKYGIKNALLGGILLSSKLSIIIATSAIGLRMGIINESFNGAVIIVTIITAIISPMIFNKAIDLPDEAGVKHVTILGKTKHTQLLASQLMGEGACVEILENNGRLADPEYLNTTELANADTVVISTDNEDADDETCLICSEHFAKKRIILITENDEKSEYAAQNGATVISPDFAVMALADSYINNPDASNLIFSEGDFEIVQVTMLNTKYMDILLKNLQLPGDCLVLSIKRKREKLIPHGNDTFKEGDQITLVGMKENTALARNMLGTRE